MPTFIPSPGEIAEIDLRDLADHPLLNGIPTWDRDSAEFAALLESIRERGQDYDILVDTELRVVDGRNRRNALRVLGRRARCRFVEGSEAATIIVSSLVNRRHLTRGAIAYLVAPIFDDVLAESRRRRTSNLLRYSDSRAQNFADRASAEAPMVGSESALSALSVKTTADIAARLGIGERLYDQALKLRRLFDQMGHEVRIKYEPRILGPWVDDDGEVQDPVGLGYMINGLTALLADQARPRQLGKRAEHDRLFIGFLPKLGLHWQKANDEQKAVIAARLKAEAMKWPEDMREGFARAIRDAAVAAKG